MGQAHHHAPPNGTILVRSASVRRAPAPLPLIERGHTPTIAHRRVPQAPRNPQKALWNRDLRPIEPGTQAARRAAAPAPETELGLHLALQSVAPAQTHPPTLALATTMTTALTE